MTGIAHSPAGDKPDAVEYGRALKGIGVNLLVTDVLAQVTFLVEVMGMAQVYSDADFAILRNGDAELMLHADGTYGDHPFLAVTGDGAIRGAGVELRIYGIDPDEAAEKAQAAGHHILQAPKNKPHGLRECYIAGPDNYIWVPGRAI